MKKHHVNLWKPNIKMKLVSNIYLNVLEKKLIKVNHFLTKHIVLLNQEKILTILGIFQNP